MKLRLILFLAAAVSAAAQEHLVIPQLGDTTDAVAAKLGLDTRGQCRRLMRGKPEMIGKYDFTEGIVYACSRDKNGTVTEFKECVDFASHDADYCLLLGFQRVTIKMNGGEVSLVEVDDSYGEGRSPNPAFDNWVELASKKYGKPTTLDVSMQQNGFGAKFPERHASWKLANGGSLRISELLVFSDGYKWPVHIWLEKAQKEEKPATTNPF